MERPFPIRDGRRCRSRRGVALVIVLSLVTLLSIMVIGLLVMAEQESRRTALQASALDARLAADSAVQIVQGQIRDATVSGIDAGGRGRHIWASQPGALRTYDDAGREVAVHKLYSSDQMIASDGAFLRNGTDMPTNWRDLPHEFVDLNEPVSRNGQWIYPVVSPDGLGTVVGFSSSRANSGAVPWDDRLAMPVRWLYLSEDGTVSADPSQGNPVIRFAFWTDDESSKINLNTASATDAQSYWDIPRATFRDDRLEYSLKQPSQNEYNRYPGHPGMVSLKTVFPEATIQDLIQVTPRYEWGGSANATVQINASRVALNNAKEEHLFATVDEFIYGDDRAVPPELENFLDAPTLDSRRFFLTTASRTSDLNLFGQPRVTIWPISAIDDANHRTPFDQLIAFCSTLGFGGAGAKPYYFVRSNPLSQTDDWVQHPRNQEIFAYLRDLTDRALPGFGGNFRAKYDTQAGGVGGEWNQILTEVFDYIRITNLNETYAQQPSSFSSYTTKINAAENLNTAVIPNRGAGWVLPILTPYGRGAGRVPMISEVGIWLIQMQDAVANTPPASGWSYTDPSPRQVQPGLIIETFSPMLGFMTWHPFNFSYGVRNITAPEINGRSLFNNAVTENYCHNPGSEIGASQAAGGVDGWGWTMATSPSASQPHDIDANPLPLRCFKWVEVWAN